MLFVCSLHSLPHGCHSTIPELPTLSAALVPLHFKRECSNCYSDYLMHAGYVIDEPLLSLSTSKWTEIVQYNCKQYYSRLVY